MFQYLELKLHHAAQLGANNGDHQGTANIQLLELLVTAGSSWRMVLIAVNCSRLLDTAGNCCKMLVNARNYWQLLQTVRNCYKRQVIAVTSC
jgi:hypothetical protein